MVGFLILASIGTVTAQEPLVRATLEAKGDIWVGQRVVLVVELLAPGFFSSAPAFDLPDPPGLMLMPPSSSPILGSETIGGISFTVQRHELSVFPQRAGEQTIPPLTVRFQYKRNPLDHDSVSSSVTTTPVHFTAKLPPGAEKLGTLISARDLKVSEVWAPEPSKAKTGDAFVRTITFTAPDVPAMAFPVFPTGKIDGVGIYTKPPEILDETNRGNLSGKRRDAITYVCQRAGQFVIPAARLTWFDLDAQRLRTIDFPARTITVAPNPAMGTAASANERTTDWRRIALVSLGSTLGIFALSFLFWKTRVFWRRVINAFRPVHLAPLNPVPQLKSR